MWIAITVVEWLRIFVDLNGESAFPRQDALVCTLLLGTCGAWLLPEQLECALHECG